MAQRLKDEVLARIGAAALRVFASAGYEGARMADVAREAGVSTGNVYRYFPSKEVLFASVVDDTFVAAFTRLLRRRVLALRGERDVDTLPPEHRYHQASRALLEFSIAERLRVVVLLGRAAGSAREAFAQAMVQDLVRLGLAHFRALQPGVRLRPAERFALVRIYRHFVATLVDILATFEQRAEIEEAVAAFSRYHLAGLRSFFAPLAAQR